MKLIKNTIEWVKEDWRSNHIRCVLEILAWLMSIGCAIAMMLTVPTPPFLILYPIFIAQCAIFAWAAKTRGSTGMVANYLLLVAIDTTALIKMWLQ
jgi:hypothetical protein